MFAQLAAGHHLLPTTNCPAVDDGHAAQEIRPAQDAQPGRGLQAGRYQEGHGNAGPIGTLGQHRLRQQSQTRGHWKRTPVGKYEYLVLSLDGKMVPWEQVPIDDLRSFETKPGDADD